MRTIITLGLLMALPAMAADITLTWDAPVTTPAVTNYVIYTSTQPITNKATVLRSNNVTNATTLTVSNLSRATMFYFVATSKEGTNESVFSNPASTNTPALPAPINLQLQLGP